MTGEDLVALARTKLGQAYALGASAALGDPDYAGPWDCAELVSWCVYRLTGERWGCLDGNPWSGAWVRDARAHPDRCVPVEAGLYTVGAVLVRAPGGKLGGHVALSQGGAWTIEAHSSSTGVVERTASGRRWDYALLVPGLDYAPPELPPGAGRLLRVTRPRMQGDDVIEVQRVVGAVPDGVYGGRTADAVARWQEKHGLVADGQVGPRTWAAIRGER